MSLYSDLSRLIGDLFGKHGIDYDRSMPLSRLVVRYFEMNTRLIQPAPRRVHFSDQIHTSLGKLLQRGAGDAREAVCRLCQHFAKGDNVNAFLSNKIRDVPSWDGLLWQYGMHHFHLRSEMGKDGFVKRSNHLLFAIVAPLDVYFVDVRRHPKKHDGVEWVRQELIRIVHSNWPKLTESNVLHGIHGAEWTDEDMHALRQKNLNYTVDIDGETIAPLGGGIAGDGSSVLCTLWASYLLQDLRYHEEELRGDDVQRAVVRDRKAWGFDASLPLEFELVFRDELALPPELLDVLTAETCISRNLCQRGFVVVDKRTRSPIVIYAGAAESAKRRARDLHKRTLCKLLLGRSEGLT